MSDELLKGSLDKDIQALPHWTVAIGSRWFSDLQSFAPLPPKYAMSV